MKASPEDMARHLCEEQFVAADYLVALGVMQEEPLEGGVKAR